jgi:hypothetical protein
MGGRPRRAGDPGRRVVGAQETSRGYFGRLADYSRGLLDRLPIAADIEPIAATFNRLKPAFEAWRSREVMQLRDLARPLPVAVDDGTPAGMNSIGILADRVTILMCKEWYLRHRQRRAAEADEVARTQTADIIAVLSQARPGQAKLLEKVSTISSHANAASFEEAYYGLLSANILMWETQELLYVRNMESIAAEELRDYIRFFSQANMMRNAFISQCETLYWRASP